MADKKCGCNHNDQITINGVYTSPVDMNTLVKPGRFKVKLGDNRPNGTARGTDALVSVAKHDQCVIQSILILVGLKVGKTFTRSSFTNGETWSEYINNTDQSVSGKLDKDFGELSKRSSLEDDDVFVIWSGEDNFKVSAAAVRRFVSGDHYKGYKEKPSELNEIINPRYGDYALIGTTKTMWVWNGEAWQDASRVTSVNGRTGDVIINAEDVLGIGKNDIITNLNAIVDALNGIEFLSYYYSGFTDPDSGNTQSIPGLVTTDKVFLIVGGIMLKQGVDFDIISDGKIIIKSIVLTVPNTIHVLKMQHFDIQKFVSDNKEENNDESGEDMPDNNEPGVVIGSSTNNTSL